MITKMPQAAARSTTPTRGTSGGRHHRIMITNHQGLPVRGQIHRQDRPILADQLPQRRQFGSRRDTLLLAPRLPLGTASSSVLVGEG
jgi:hypothetical protein